MKNKTKINKLLSVFLALIILILLIPLNSKVSFASNNLINLRRSNTGFWETDTPNKGIGYSERTSPAFYLTYKGEEYIGYCIEASVDYPENGNYTRLVENQFKQSSKDFLRKIYYYTYKAKGNNKIKTFLNQHAKQYLKDYLEYNRQKSGRIYYLNSIKGINTYQYHYIHYFVSEYLKNNERTNNNESFISGKSLAGYTTFKNIVNSIPKAPDSFKYHILQTDNRSRINKNGTIQLISFFSIKETPKRNFSIHKESANKTLTNIIKAGYSIKGATYGVYKTRANAINNTKRWQTLVTKVNGDTQTIKLPEGEYWVKELTAPKGFLLDPLPHKVVLAGSNKVLRVTDKPKFDPIKLVLRGKVNRKNEPLAGAKFKIEYFRENNLTVKQAQKKQAYKTWLYETNTKGQIITKNTLQGSDKLFKDEHGKEVFLPGSYLITETEAPIVNGIKYKIAKPVIVNMEFGEINGGTQVFNAPTIVDEKYNIDIPLVKVDPLTNNLITTKSFKGTKFDLIFVSSTFDPNHQAGEVLQTKVLDKNNRLVFKDVNEGVYDIVEKSTVNGYQLNKIATRIQVSLKENSNELEMKQLTWTAEAIYDLYDKKVDELNSINRTNTKGKTPYFKEMQHSTRFTLEQAHEKLPGNNNAILFPNMQEYGRISITKHFESTNKDNSTLSGIKEKESDITFEVLKDGQIVDSIITDKEGRATTKWLPFGKYTIHQKTKKDKYLNVEDFEVTISKSWGEYQYNLENLPNSKAIKIVKKDAETGKEIAQAGVKFQLLNSKKEVIRIKELTEFTTGKDGKVTLPENVMPGKYYLRETKSPQGYYLDPNGKDIEFDILDNEVKIVVQEVENIPQKGQLILHKRAKILVKTNKENIEQKEVTKLVFEEGYLAKTKWVIKAKEDIISKDGKTKIYNAGDIVDTLITNSKGEIKSKLLPLGKYQLEETKAPKEYVRDKKVYDIEFTPQEQNIRVDSLVENIINERKTLTFEFTKEFEGSKHFDRDMFAIFGLYNKEEITENGVKIAKDTLLDVAKVEVKEKVPEKSEYIVKGKFSDILIDGKFYIKELETAKGYILDDKKYEENFNFEDTNEKVTTITKINPIKNKLKRIKLQIVKVEKGSNNKIKLPNAKFRLVAIDKTLGESIIGEYITNKQGLIVIDKLETGGVKYYLQEVQSPKGYIKKTEKIEINTPKDNKKENITVKKVVVENEKKPKNPHTGDTGIATPLIIFYVAICLLFLFSKKYQINEILSIDKK